MHVPCGCESRKEIMFTKGNIGAVEVTILAGAILAVLLALKARSS